MAFPNTPLLEDFAGAPASPPSANWTRQGAAASDLARDGAGQCKSNGPFAGDWWNPAAFGPDSEAYVTVSVLPTSVGRAIRLHVRSVNPSDAAARTGYLLAWTWVAGGGNDTWQVFRRDPGVSTQLGATVTGPDVAPGERVGLAAVGPTLTGYRYSSGAWSQVVQRSDGTYGSAGNIALGIDPDATDPVRLDDFGGGTVPEMTLSPPPVLTVGLH